MNTQIVTIRDALKSKVPFFLVTAFIPASLFLKAGFVSVGVLWFFALCLFNYRLPSLAECKRHYHLIFPILLYVLYCTGLFYSENFSEAMKIVLRKVHLVIIPLGFIVADKKFTDREFHTILLIFLIAYIASSLFCYGVAVLNIVQNKPIAYPSVYKLYYSSYTPLTEPLGIAPIYLGMYSILAFIIAWKSPLIKSPLTRNCIAIYLVVFIILNAFKIGIIALVLTFSISVVERKKRKVISRLILVFIIVAIVIAALKFPFLKERFLASTAFEYSEEHGSVWNSTTLRVAIWSSAIEAVKKSPLLGHGPGDGQAALEEAYLESGFVWGLYYQHQPGIPQYNAHNEFITTMLDVGILGLLVLLLLFAFSFEYSIRSKDTLRIGFMIIILLSFCIESVLSRQKGIVFFSFFYSLMFWHKGNKN